jgi:acyl carrier protein
MLKFRFTILALVIAFAGPNVRAAADDDEAMKLKIERLEAENEALKTELARLRRENAELKARITVAQPAAVPLPRQAVGPASKRESDGGNGTEEAIRTVITKHFPKVPKDLDKKKPLSDPPMNLDELDAVELIMALEERFNTEIPDSLVEKHAGKLGLGPFRATLEQLTKIVEESKNSPPKSKKK